MKTYFLYGVAVVFLFVVVALLRSQFRKWQMKKQGYSVHWLPAGTEDGSVFYEEGERRLEFDFSFYKGEQFKPIVYVPADKDWDKVMPDWVKHRKDEVVARITKHFHWKCEDANDSSQSYWREGNWR